jgi:tetratricopeptide (TPR) repeat protein
LRDLRRILRLSSTIAIAGVAGALTCLDPGVCLGATAQPARKVTAKPKANSKASPQKPRKTIEQQIREFRFVADFSPKEETREIPGELFWRYPLELPKVEFPFEAEFTDLAREFPRTDGEGRAVQHLNRARTLFLEGDLEGARKSLLSAKARYGKEYSYHRRTDYLLAYVFMKEALADMAARHVDLDDPKTKGKFSNAATFLTWAFNLKKDVPDPLVDFATPKGLYNLAAIYFRYDRFAGSFGAASLGLDFLRASGRKEFRMAFRRINAENYIKNGTFLEAVQELDEALRQDYNPADAAAILHRAGDIYFNLNNYELAEEAYDLGARADESLRQISPAQLILRAESLFWLKRFKEAQLMLYNALEGAAFRKQKNLPSPAAAAWGALRSADIHLALKDVEKARLGYFRVTSEHRNQVAAKVAKVRLACLELPQYQGNNITHAREELAGLRGDNDLPPGARELAWACHTASYSSRERTPEMLEKVRAFSKAWPDSRFLKEMAEPVRETQAKSIENYFGAGDDYGAIAFFENNRKRLFPKSVPPAVQQKLFRAYVDTGRSPKAIEFIPSVDQKNVSDVDLLRIMTALSETRNAKKIIARSNQLTSRKWTIKRDLASEDFIARIVEMNLDMANMPWLVKLYDAWGEADEGLMCEGQIALWTRASTLPEKTRRKMQLAARVSKAISEYMPDLLEDDPSCAATLLDMEYNLQAKNPMRLADTYLSRKDWKQSPESIRHVWALSETLAGTSPGSAKKLWQMIVEKGEPGSNEVIFAKSRLDPNATEFEKIWR